MWDDPLTRWAALAAVSLIPSSFAAWYFDRWWLALVGPAIVIAIFLLLLLIVAIGIAFSNGL